VCVLTFATASFQGTFRGPPRSYDVGSVLLTTFGHNQSNAGPFLTMNADSAVDGLIIHYPLQIGWPAPVPYGPTIRQAGDSPTIRNLFVSNPWWMLDLGTITGGRHVVDGVWGQPLKLGLYIDNCFDVGRVTNVHFWPFWNISEAFWSGWTAQHATAFLLGRSDWQMFDKVFSFAYAIGWHFVGGTTGDGGNYLITNSGSDEPGVPVLVDVAWPVQGIMFTNSQFMGATIELSATNTAPVKFSSCAFNGNPAPSNLGYNGTDVIIRVDGGSLKVDQSEFNYWAQMNSGSPAISVGASGRAVIAHSEFRNGPGGVVAGFDTGSHGIIVDNLCAGQCEVLGNTSNTVVVRDNVAF